jgi:hypothetical protein
MESMSSLKVHVTVSSLLTHIQHYSAGFCSSEGEEARGIHALNLSTRPPDDHRNQQVSSVQRHNTTDYET